MSKDIDIEEFGKMFDAALGSKNPAVQKALRNFMMICAMVHAEDEEERTDGPFQSLLSRLEALEQRIAMQESRNYNRMDSYSIDTSTSTSPWNSKHYPTWLYNTVPYSGGTTTSSHTHTTSIADCSNISSMNLTKYVDDMEEILKDFTYKDS